MNELNARAVAWQGQFIGQFRKVHKAGWETVRVNGAPALFDDWRDAKLAAWDAVRGHMGEVFGYRGGSVSVRDRVEAEWQKVTGHGEASRPQAQD